MTGFVKTLRRSQWALILVLILAALLRLYRLSDYLQFLGDEGRDALIVMHMITGHEWTLLGPTASVGGFYIGGLYYYFMLPFLALFGLNPVGPAYMAAAFGVGTILLGYILGKHFWNRKVGLMIAFLLTVSPYLINTSRFSWNPNPIPFFALATILCLYFAQKKQSHRYTFFAGLFTGVLLELHYINLVFLPIFGLSVLLLFPNRRAVGHLLLGAAGILLGNSMYIIFELRHNFPNTRSVMEFVFRGTNIAPRSVNPFSLFDDTTRMLYDSAFGFQGLGIRFLQYFSLAGTLLWSAANFNKVTVRPKIILLWTWFAVGITGVALYRGTLLPHYFSYLYPLPFILTALALWQVSKVKFGRVIVGVFLSILTIVELSVSYLQSPPNRLLVQTQQVDRIVLSLTENKPYNFALVTLTNSDHAYRYYLELWGTPPTTIENPQIDPDRKTVTEQLIAVCEQKNCAPLGNPLWEVAGFGRAQIAQKVDGPAGIVIYKLVHYRGE